MSNNTLNLILAFNRPSLFKELLKKGNVDHKELLYYLLKNRSTKVAKNNDIIQSIYNSTQFNVKEKLLIFVDASKRGLIEVIKLLLPELKNKRGFVNVINYAIGWASRYGHPEVVKLLLTDPRVDLSIWNNWAIRSASKNGHTKVVKLLLADSRVYPSSLNDYAIGWAAKNGYIEIVRLLLADPRVDPRAEDNYAIREASQNGWSEVTKELSLHSKISRSNLLDSTILSIIVKAWLVF